MLRDEGTVEEVEGVAMRPIPLRRYWWSTVPWISETGDLRKRHYNARTNEWHWEPRLRPPVLDKRGRLGHRLQNQFRPLAQLIALAWVRRHAPMDRMRAVVLVEPSDGLVAHNLRYVDDGEPSAGEDATSDDSASIVELEGDDETWRDLECKVGIVPCVDVGVRLSSHGRVCVDGVVSRGVPSLGGHVCLVPGVPPVPIERVRDLLFGAPRRERPPPRMARVIVLLREGASVREVARRMRIKPTTAWSYAHVALRFVSTSSAGRFTRQLMHDPDVEAPFRQLVDEAPHLLHAPLRAIVDLFTRTCMACDLQWRSNPHRYAEVCALRALLQREA